MTLYSARVRQFGYGATSSTLAFAEAATRRHASAEFVQELFYMLCLKQHETYF